MKCEVELLDIHTMPQYQEALREAMLFQLALQEFYGSHDPVIFLTLKNEKIRRYIQKSKRKLKQLFQTSKNISISFGYYGERGVTVRIWFHRETKNGRRNDYCIESCHLPQENQWEVEAGRA